MKKLHKLVFSLLFISLILPNLAFASWWNPFSWSIFHKPVKTEVIKIATSTTVQEKDYNKLIEDKNKLKQTIKSKVNENEINKLIDNKNTLKEVISNNIINNKISTTTNTDKGTPYKGIDGNWYYPNVWDSIGNHVQAPSPIVATSTQNSESLTINIDSVSCSLGVCTFMWSTNYSSNSEIVINGNGTSKFFYAIKSNSQSGFSKYHSTKINLPEGLIYSYTIYANTDSDSVQKSGSFSTVCCSA